MSAAQINFLYLLLFTFSSAYYQIFFKIYLIFNYKMKKIADSLKIFI
jgi:hypothetical protein